MSTTETAPPASQEFHRLSFTGNAAEYFGIWIVNILLTIVTLGIYSAWAKVRRNRYFYGNTVLLGRAFEYHAKGKQIFIGRLIVFGYLIVYNILLTAFPIAGIALGVIILFFFPWLIMRGLRFSARVTSYRNVRFDFKGRMGGAFVAFMAGPVMAFLSLGILAPLASRWMYRYIGNNLRYGGRSFATDPRLGPIYKTWFLSALIVVLGMLIVAVVAFANLPVIAALIDDADALSPDSRTSFIVLAVAGYLAVVLSFGIAALFYRAGVRNIAWSATVFDGRHPVQSDLSRGRYVWIALSNVVVTVLTLGLMRPWAAVRMARYVNEHTAICFDGDVGEILAAVEQEGTAVGAEFMEFEGFDFGF
ncbi:YjgN family protein [Pararhizobium sp. BT-229]|uniref:YjgN family protein n=1 Tax=Pararhizobium sp. BT-229 TaxID=2986923 RepID=UPI0021F7CAEB|nr:YjgN family protein [Pararhizobium sp. BT-229]MCV9962896.1 YjgN family protein [Pararhizobium sp. BT-229]